LHGKIIVEPQFKCAWPFENGVAQVSYNCSIIKDGELDLWKGGDWFYIDKNGNKKKALKIVNFVALLYFLFITIP